jgi:hypothetical protein
MYHYTNNYNTKKLYFVVRRLSNVGEAVPPKSRKKRLWERLINYRKNTSKTLGSSNFPKFIFEAIESRSILSVFRCFSITPHTDRPAKVPAFRVKVTNSQWRRQGGGARGANSPQNYFLPPPPLKKCISHWERLKATQAFCRYRKMYGL